MLRLLGRATSGNVQKVMWLCEELGQPYNREDYGRQFNNTQTEAYLSLNPTGKVPTVVDGEVVVWESNTILRYICGKSPAGAALYPADPAVRTHIERWMDWQLASLNGPYLNVFKEAKKKPEERGATWGADSKELAAQLETLEKGTSGRPWIAGSAFSIADICLGPIVDRCIKFPIEVPPLPGVKSWLAKIAARPAFKKVAS